MWNLPNEQKYIFGKDFTQLKLTGEPLKQVSQQYDDMAFEKLFKVHYKELHAYANTMLRDSDTAEEIVQTMFLRFWEKRNLLTVQTSIKAYLYKCVYHDSLNYIKHEQVKRKYQDFASYALHNQHEAPSSRVALTELEFELQEALNELPEHCRTVFQLSRFEELKYKEIAAQLGISIKTVENQMGKALKILRVKLADFLSVMVLILSTLIVYYKDFLK